MRSPPSRDKIMDPLSIAASTAALLHCTKIIINFTKDFINAGEERQKFVKELETLLIMVDELEKHRKASNDEDPWYQRLKRMVEKSGTFTPEGKYIPYPDPDKKPTGPLTNLYITIADLQSQLHADQPSHGLRKSIERFKWYRDKEKFTKVLHDIAGNCAAVARILDLDHFEASKAAAISSRAAEGFSKATAEYVRLQADQVTDIGLRMKTLEEYNIKKQKKEEEEEDERKRETIMKWLSPTLDFLARQKDLYENCFKPAGQWLLDDDDFQRWALGQSWHLRCHGVPGSGKVGV